jgi:hypothetical protein
VTIDQQIDETHRAVLLTLTGTLSDEGLASLTELIENTPTVAKDFSLLIDLRFADGKKITTAGVQHLAAKRLVLSPEAKRAVVVPSVLGYFMARLYQLLRGRGGFRVFMDYDEAQRWIQASGPSQQGPAFQPH